MTTITLDHLPPHTAGYIESIDLPDAIRRRLQDLGLIPHALVKRCFAAPAGTPIAYEIQGSLVALRKKDAAQICVQMEEAAS